MKEDFYGEVWELVKDFNAEELDKVLKILEEE